MEFNEKTKAKVIDYLKLDGQVWEEAGDVVYVDNQSTITYRQRWEFKIQVRNLRASKMAMFPLVCTFLLKLERIFTCVYHTLHSFKWIQKASMKSQVEMD